MLRGRGQRDSVHPGAKPSWFRPGLPAVIVFFTGLCLSLVAFQITWDLYRSVAEQEFDRQASHYILALRKAVDRHVELTGTAAELFDDSTKVTGRWDLFAFARDRLPYYPGFQAIAWVPIVPQSERDDYVRRAEADGLSGFDFTEITGTGRVVSAARRRRHLPMYFVEPYEGNEDLLGFDMSSVPALRSALGRSSHDPGLQVVDWLDPRGGTHRNSKTLMLIQPVFSLAAAVDADGQSELEGYVVGLVRIDRLFGTTLREFTTPAWLDTYLYRYRSSESDELIHIEPSVLRTPDMAAPAEAQRATNFVATADISIGDRRHSIVIQPVAGKMDFDLGAVPWGVALFGLALTLLLTHYIAASRHKQRQIEIAVVERTAELSRANEANTRLEREIQERRRMEAELRAAKDEAEVASRAKSEFLAMVSHELRTPLNAIIGFSEMLTSEMFGAIGDSRYKGYAADIRNSGLHLLSLINDILDLSKVEAKSFELNEENIEIPELIGNALHLVEAKAKAGGIRLKPELPATPPVLYADERALKQIVLNMLSNAVKFTPPGGRVTVKAEQSPRGEFVIVIADTGIGIAEDDQEKILKPFTQVDSSLARRYEGTGLGLPLTKSLVELHGGRFELDSEPNKGTTVRAVFPAERVISESIAAE